MIKIWLKCQFCSPVILKFTESNYFKLKRRQNDMIHQYEEKKLRFDFKTDITTIFGIQKRSANIFWVSARFAENNFQFSVTESTQDINLISFRTLLNFRSQIRTDQNPLKQPLCLTTSNSFTKAAPAFFFYKMEWIYSTPSEVLAILCEPCSWKIEIFPATAKFSSLIRGDL